MPYLGEPYGSANNRKPKWNNAANPPDWKQKKHFAPNDYDLLEKERLAARSFGHIRHKVYKNVTQPQSNALSYCPEPKRFDTDSNALLKKEHAQAHTRKKAIQELRKTDRACRDYQAFHDREKEWINTLERETWMRQIHPHARVIANKNSVPYDLLTLQYHDNTEGDNAKYKDAAARWRAAMRAIRLYSKMNGSLDYNFLNWERRPPTIYPHKPLPPPPISQQQQSHSQPEEAPSPLDTRGNFHSIREISVQESV